MLNIVKQIFFRGDVTSLNLAAQKGDLKTVSQLMEKGVFVNAGNNICGPALHSATGEGHLEIVKLLIGKGVDVNAKDKNEGCKIGNYIDDVCGFNACRGNNEPGK